MVERLIEIVVPTRRVDSLAPVMDREGVLAHWRVSENDDVCVWKAIVDLSASEGVLDELEDRLGGEDRFRAIVMTMEATSPSIARVPAPAPDQPESKPARVPMRVSRAELYEDIAGASVVDHHYVIQVVLATVVAAVGLLRDQPAIVIAAMVIAPLLGPNMALALGATLGDTSLIRRSIRASLVGVSIAFGLSLGLGLVPGFDASVDEIASRTSVGAADVALALASGVAGTLAFTSGKGGALVGVMVAIALLPPTVVAGAMVGAGRWSEALGAGLLLGVNVVCVNLAGVATFLFKGIRPARWWEAERSKRASRRAILIWGALLLALVGMIALRAVLNGGGNGVVDL